MVAHTKLYEVLGVGADASQAEITKAFRIRARVVHPDKNPGDASANERFQLLQSSFDILKDPKRRQRYDATGCTEDDTADFQEAYEKFRSSFVEISEEDIDSFAESYKGSDEEIEDVINYYERYSGDLTYFFDFVPLSDPSECHRFIVLIRRLIEEDRLETTRRFTQTSEKLSSIGERWQKKHSKEAKQAAKRKQSSFPDALPSRKKRRSGEENSDSSQKVDDLKSLVLAIRGNQTKRSTRTPGFMEVVDKVAAASAGDRELPPPPTEEEFLAARNRLTNRDSSSSTAKRGEKRKPAAKSRKTK